jgi:N utilization substance protein B
MSKKRRRNYGITRRDSRERAIQILFSLDFNKVEDIPSYLKNYEEEIYKSLSKDKYLLELLNGILRNLEEIDKLIDDRIEFSVKSLGKVVLSVLRLAVYEIKIEQLDSPLVITEAIQIVRKYGSTEDVKFINAVLDNLAMNN